MEINSTTQIAHIMEWRNTWIVGIPLSINILYPKQLSPFKFDNTNDEGELL